MANYPALPASASDEGSATIPNLVDGSKNL